MATDSIIHSSTIRDRRVDLVIYDDIPRQRAGGGFVPGKEIARTELVNDHPDIKDIHTPYAVTRDTITIPTGSFLRIERDVEEV